MKKRTSENGQAIVLIVLAIIAIFGFAALAVDGGRIYAERRRAQNAADAAALAAAYTAANSSKSGPPAVFNEAAEKAYAAMVENDYQLDTSALVPIYDKATGTQIVGYQGDSFEIYSPPTHGEFEECECEYVQVIVHSHVDPVFLQVLGRYGSDITTESIARGRHSQPISTYNAVHALSHSGSPLTLSGTADMTVTGGHVLSNADGNKNGGPGTLTVNNGHLKTAGRWTNTRGVSADLRQGVDPEDPPTPPDPVCEGDGSYDSASNTFHPGNFGSGIRVNGNNDVTFEDGLYCVTGGMTFNGNGEVTANSGVTFYLETGGITVNGNRTFTYKRPNDLLDAKGRQWGGMLFYVAVGNSSTIDITGTSGSSFTGTIYNPSGQCKVGGNATITLNGDLICNTIDVYGTPNLTVNYVYDQNYRMMPVVEQIE